LSTFQDGATQKTRPSANALGPVKSSAIILRASHPLDTDAKKGAQV
jgi:hypothetical protein